MASLSARRAWIEIISTVARSAPYWSLSARRAWIEIHRPSTSFTQYSVALRKESVDRNDFAISSAPGYHKSLSARRAWIEIALWFA